MTKIPFSIAYRPQVESGEYRVVTREDRPVEIRIWDLKGDFPVVGVYYDEKNDRETAVQVTDKGRCSIKPSDDYCDDFFIITGMPTDRRLKKDLEFSSKIKFEKSPENPVSVDSDVDGYNPFNDFRKSDTEKTFEIEKGKRYLCIKDCSCSEKINFKKGYSYVFDLNSGLNLEETFLLSGIDNPQDYFLQVTEFEEVFANLLGHYYVCKSDSGTDFDMDFAKEYAQDLLNAARKQINSELGEMDCEFYKLIMKYKPSRNYSKFCVNLIYWWKNTRRFIKAERQSEQQPVAASCTNEKGVVSSREAKGVLGEIKQN